jgi:hypothetical protein
MKYLLLILSVFYLQSANSQTRRVYYRDFFGIYKMPDNNSVRCLVFDTSYVRGDSIIYWVSDKSGRKDWIDSLNKMRVGINHKPTKFRKGIAFHTTDGLDVVLLEWVKVDNATTYSPDTYRWRCRYYYSTPYGTDSYLGYTDDIWIRYYTTGIKSWD